MTRNKVLSCKFARFAELLGYSWKPDPAGTGVNGWRVYGSRRVVDPSVLAPLYIQGTKYKPGRIKFLQPLYDIMNRVFLNTIAVKGGNFDAIHSYHINLMHQTYLHKDKEGEEDILDVMDYLWYDMWATMIGRKSCSFGPYIMLLILDSWHKATDGEDLWDLVKENEITKHKVRRPLVKDHNPDLKDAKLKDPVVPDDMPDSDEDEDEEADPDFDPAMRRPVEESSMLTKVLDKLRRSFCFKIELQKKMYKEHERSKKAARRQKEMMRAMNLPVSDGSDKVITP
jgi:hypothetical protein